MEWSMNRTLILWLFERHTSHHAFAHLASSSSLSMEAVKRYRIRVRKSSHKIQLLFNILLYYFHIFPQGNESRSLLCSQDTAQLWDYCIQAVAKAWEISLRIPLLNTPLWFNLVSHRVSTLVHTEAGSLNLYLPV